MRILDIREYRGKNIYSHYPVVKITLDLEELAEVWSDTIPGFAERLSQILPGLNEHFCTRGRKGGFLERLREGTLLGHVIEHVSLELQSLVGHKVMYGKTMATGKPGIYDIITEAEIAETGVEALKGAISIIKALVEEGDCNLPQVIDKLKDTAAVYGFGPSTAAIVQECRKRDIPVMRLGEGSLLQLGYGVHQRRIEATITGLTSCIAADIASNKDLTKKLLAENGIPVPQGILVEDVESALDAFKKLGSSVVLKPYNGNQGKGVSLNLSKEEEIRKAFALASRYSDKILVEKYLPGRHFRLLVINYQVVAAAERVPAHVTGDGSHSIKELVDLINRDPQRGVGHEGPLTKISIDEQALFVLARQGISPDMVPAAGQVVYLRENANLSTGGTAIDVTDLINPQTKRIAQRAARVIGLDVAGIDIVCKDITKPFTPDQGAVIEVNAAPGFRMHLHPAGGQPRNVARNYVEYLFPSGSPARIPIISITGTNGKTTTTRLIAYVLQQWGKCVGYTTTGGTYIGNECLFKGDTTGPLSAQAVLRDPRVEVAVLETARGGIIRAGLGYDKATIGIVTNISEDHLGIAGVEDLEQLAMIKALVVEALEKGGTAVLNADDPWSQEIAKRVREEIILFSVNEENILIRRH